MCADITTPRLIPDGDRALAELREIARCPEGLVEIGRLINEGTPLLRAYIDALPAGGTGDIIARYEICELLLPVLTAVRAGNGQVSKIEGALDHGDLPKVTPKMIEAGEEVIRDQWPFLNDLADPSLIRNLASSVYREMAKASS
jgi:hypothetical protein